ncbi:unnamed protein product [Eruca vesicaria subsp. sativa]|uniref:Uncharacterized protein n=1 Tax=Eruca vesicaria subsp. sativa TaxID=29727 RepID=A0ABC8M070_ERUVS|nr:unnamed protein product [Eruca vesicaria subsp. sativa]
MKYEENVMTWRRIIGCKLTTTKVACVRAYLSSEGEAACNLSSSTVSSCSNHGYGAVYPPSSSALNQYQQ